MSTSHVGPQGGLHIDAVAQTAEPKVRGYLKSRRPIWFGPTMAAAAALAVCVAVALRDPREEGSFATCPWLFLTGTQCPGCGTLRSLNRLVGGDLVGAFGYNVLSVLAVPVLAYAWLRWALPMKLSRCLPWFRTEPGKVKAAWALTILLLAFGALRNLPWEPFIWLLPTS